MKKWWPVLVVIFFGLLAGKGLIGQGYFNMHDDLQMMRQLEMEKCFLDGQIPCRWVPDMGYGFGFPLFNFYPPLPYLIGQGIRLFGFSFINTVKIVFILAFVASGVTMYFLAKKFFGCLGGVVAAVFYIWAPYHAVDVYVRGAMNEVWAMVWFPLILLAGYQLIKQEKKLFKWIVILALSFFGLFVSHNLMLLIFTPVFGIWVLIWLLREKKWSRLPHLFLAGVWALSLAAFFTVPAVIENKFTQIESVLSGYYNFTAHFVDLNQLFISRFWGYGPSVWGVEEDRMSFQIGWIHWGMSLVILLLFVYRFFKKRKLDNWLLITGYFLVIGWLAAFLAHSKSTPIWQLVTPLRYLQFPWRFLTLIVFSFSFVAGALAWFLEKKQQENKINIKQKLYLFGLVITSVLIFSWNYFLPEHGKLGALTDEEKFSGAAWELQQTAGIFDYLPATAKTAPKEPMKNLVEFVGENGGILTEVGEVKETSQRTNWAKAVIEVPDEILVRLGIFQFPGWQVWVNGQPVEPFVPEVEEWGRMWIRVPAGESKIEAKFVNTPVRTISNGVSAIAWLGLATSPIWRKRFSL